MEVEAYLNAFLNSALGGNEFSAFSLSLLIPEKGGRYALVRGLGGLQN